MNDRPTHEPRGLPLPVKLLGLSLIVAGVLIVASVAGLMLTGEPRDGAVAQPARADLQPLDYFGDITFPAFEGVSQTSAAITDDILDGQVTVVDFFFTHCPLICPVMTSRMMEQAEKLAGTNVRFLSISVDPEHDTPAVIAEFAARYSADPDQWTFVRVPPEDVASIADTLGFMVRKNANDQIPVSQDKTMDNIIHPVSMLLIGPDRRIYGRYHYNFPEEMDQLTTDARRLAQQN